MILEKHVEMNMHCAGVGKSHFGALFIAQTLLDGTDILLECLENTTKADQRHWYWLSLNQGQPLYFSCALLTVELVRTCAVLFKLLLIAGSVDHTEDKALAIKRLKQNKSARYVVDGCPPGT